MASADKNQFIDHISEGVSRFGMTVESSSAIDSGMNKLVMKDNAHNTGYVAIAKRNDTKNPADFWGGVIDNQLKDALKETSYKGDPLPAAIIVPSVEADAVIAESAKRNVRPSVYQLFDGYVIVGYKRKDSLILMNKGNEESRAEPAKNDHQANTFKQQEEPLPQAEQKNAARQKNDEQFTQSSIQSSVKEEKSEKGGINPKKIAAAALLGVALASIPFAINKLKDKPNFMVEVNDNKLAPDAESHNSSIIDGNVGEPGIQSALAKNARLSEDEIAKLIADGYKSELAQNPNLNEDNMNMFASDPNPAVRSALAGNNNAPDNVIRKLSNDPSVKVRSAIAANANTPYDVLEKFSDDKELGLSLLGNPNMSPEWLDKIEPNIASAPCASKEKIFAGPCANKSMLGYNVKNPDGCIRRGIAKNPATTKEDLVVLMNDSDRAVRSSALSNPGIGRDTLMKLYPVSWGGKSTMSEGDPQYAADLQAALKNPATPKHVLHSASLINPGRYGEYIAQNSNLSRSDAQLLYDYSLPRGGMRGFMTDLNKLAFDKELVEQFSGKSGVGEGNVNAKAVSSLRNRVNQLFSDNVYNPLIFVKRFTKYGQPDNARDFKLLEEIDDEEFFEDDPVSKFKLDENNDRYEGFFDDVADELGNNVEKAGAALKAADDVVNDVMDELLPIIQRAADEKTGKKLSPSDNNDAVKSDSSGKSGRQGISSGSAGGNAQTGNAYTPNGEILTYKVPVLSDDLYNKSCKKVESALKLY